MALRLVTCAGLGVVDALSLAVPVRVLLASKTVQTSAIKCVVLNGILFMGSLFMFAFIIRPLLGLVLPSSSSAETDGDAKRIQDTITYFDFALTAIYHLFWVYPIYCLSFILNSIWYQDIADAAYAHQVGKPTAVRTDQRVGDEIYRSIMQLVMVVQIAMIHFIPLIGPYASFLLMAWLYSMYCFEYKWINEGQSLDQRVAYFEEHWAYLAGFGTPFAALTFFFPQFIGAGLFALAFPGFIIMANSASPVKPLPEEAPALRRIPMLYVGKQVTAWLIYNHFFFPRRGGSQQPRR
ncbi:hypothetical protein CAOG_003894 [Capsaspora owczarzaki ATCC 30864]|uniref:Etoposide-induced protein 2.4-domain-containing protein n=1 Tax=Capsaspora owczarzaki (strain ATCC 30864) TaxID=595528 RepID=A0A0D2WQ80_CAPO3|nr:hypothetical protein CAOG_003894 [Capsaspora owczarzaki ATCC 30864]